MKFNFHKLSNKLTGGPDVSAHVLLNLLNELNGEKRPNKLGWQSVLIAFSKHV